MKSLSNKSNLDKKIIKLTKKIQSINDETLSKMYSPKIVFMLEPELSVKLINDFKRASFNAYELSQSFSIDAHLYKNKDLAEIIFSLILEREIKSSLNADEWSSFFKSKILKSMDSFKIQKELNRNSHRTLGISYFDNSDEELNKAHRFIIELSLLLEANKHTFDCRSSIDYLEQAKNELRILSKSSGSALEQAKDDSFWGIDL